MSKLNLKMQPRKLSGLMLDLGVYSQDAEVKGVAEDTRLLKAGDAFLCMPRAKDTQFLVVEAINKGASAIIFIGVNKADTSIPCACLADMAAAGVFLRRWFETESTSVRCIGVTGTDGKTSTAWMLREALALHLGSAWSCGTLGLVKDADDIVDLGNTTPSLLTLHTLLALAQQQQISALVLEVSSHGIAQQRIAGLPFQAAVWTTMGRDHLEDHGGFEAYFNCKREFILSVAQAGGIVIANAAYPLIQQALQGAVGQVFWYAQEKQADLLWMRHNSEITLTDKREEVSLKHMPLADFHAENLAAIALLMKEATQFSLADFMALDGKISTPMGRLEPVDAEQHVFIDYAHTAEGLERCLLSAKDLSQQQLLLVFGCGGDRDKTKRPEMGAVAVKYADQCWLTSDNPRSEKQADIATDVLAGVGELSAKVHVCEDRNKAIQQAVSAMQQGDILVIAGKGHESYMEIQGERLPWSDKGVAMVAIQNAAVRQCA